MTETPVRASDVDRQLIVEVLQEQTAAGRLSLDEFSERVAGAYSATTRRELDDLVADLPTAPVWGAGRGSDAAVAEPVGPTVAPDVAAPVVCCLTVLIVIGLLAGSPAALLVLVAVGFAAWRRVARRVGGGGQAARAADAVAAGWRPGSRQSLWAVGSSGRQGGGIPEDGRHD
jgi:hypothetical protein